MNHKTMMDYCDGVSDIIDIELIREQFPKNKLSGLSYIELKKLEIKAENKKILSKTNRK